MTWNAIELNIIANAQFSLFYSHFHKWFIYFPMPLPFLVSTLSTQYCLFFIVPCVQWMATQTRLQCHYYEISKAICEISTIQWKTDRKCIRFNFRPILVRVVINLAKRQATRETTGQWCRETILNAQHYHGLIIHTQSPAVPLLQNGKWDGFPVSDCDLLWRPILSVTLGSDRSCSLLYSYNAAPPRPVSLFYLLHCLFLSGCPLQNNA